MRVLICTYPNRRSTHIIITCIVAADPLPRCTTASFFQAWKVLNDVPNAKNYDEAKAVTNRGCALSGSFRTNNKAQFCTQTCKRAYCNFVAVPAINKCTSPDTGQPSTQSFAQFMASDNIVYHLLKKLYPCSMIDISSCTGTTTNPTPTNKISPVEDKVDIIHVNKLLLIMVTAITTLSFF